MFKTKEDIDAYLSGDRIKCLECGKWFKSLGPHIFKKHEMTAIEYKLKYSIPMNRGLEGKYQIEKKSIRAREAHKDGLLSISHAKTKKPDMKKARNKPFYHQNNFFIGADKARQELKLKDSIFIEFLSRLKSGRLVKDVAKDEDMPSFAAVYDYASVNPNYKQELQAITKENKSKFIKDLRLKEKLLKNNR